MALFGTGAGGSGSVLRLEVAKHCSAVVSENWNRNKKKKQNVNVLESMHICTYCCVYVYVKLCMYMCIFVCMCVCRGVCMCAIEGEGGEREKSVERGELERGLILDWVQSVAVLGRKSLRFATKVHYSCN